MKQKRKIRFIVYGVSFLFLVIGGLLYQYASKPAPHVHLKLKDLKINALEFDSLGVSEESIEDIKKKSHVLMIFFTLNCKDTKANIQAFNELHKREDLAVVGYMMLGERRAKKYARNYDVQFPLVKASKNYMKIFEPNTTPTMYLVRTADMKARDKYVGRIIPHKVITKIKDTF